MLTADLTEAYELGRSHQDWEEFDEFGWAGPADVPAEIALNPARWLFYECGVTGRQMPPRVRGWRYGEIPAAGCSTNYRDGHAEAGVSLMSLGEPGGDDTDGTFALFNDGRPVVKVEGWLLPQRGSDGERLVAGAVAV